MKEKEVQMRNVSTPLQNLYQFTSSSQASVIYSVGLRDRKFIFEHKLS